MDLDWGNAPAWIAAIAATIAAAASVATWRRLHPPVRWQIRPGQRHSRYQIVHGGNRPAYDVQLRVGSASDPSHSDYPSQQRAVVQPGEVINVTDDMTYESPVDYAFNLTWRSRWSRRRRSWSYQLT